MAQPVPVNHRLLQSANIVSNGIVREDAISYYVDSLGDGWFVNLNSYILGYNYYKVKVPDNWSVKDFRVMDTIVYFCGIDNNTQTAILGHFNTPPPDFRQRKHYIL